MHSLSCKRGALLVCLAALTLTAFTPSAAAAKPEPGKKGFRLFAGAGGALQVNRVFCGLTSFGNICTDSTGSSTIGGGFWPRGTANQYVFNSGLQVAGIIGPDGGPWAGHTTGAFIFNARGGGDGQEVEPIFNSNNPDDAANWPEAAKVPTELVAEDNLFNPLLRGRVSASQGDIWYVAWDGNPAQIASRPHPLGIAVETRGMGWNFPPGNQDILYFTFTIYNVSSSDPAAYANARPEIRDILAEAGAEFQTLNEAAFGVDLPDGGYTLTNLFASFGADMDVADFSVNYSSVNLPFALGYTYEHTFGQPPGWTFDPGVFGAPFFPGVGFVGVKYLRSPTGAGEIQLFSNTLNQAVGFFDPQNAAQLYRYLSGTVSPAAGDQACNFGPPAVTHICFIASTAADSRFFQSSTPLTLAPGEFGSIVVAYIFAAPVAVPGFNPPVSDEPPGDPRLLTDVSALEAGNVNRIDQLTGFQSYSDNPPAGNGDGVAQQSEFTVVPGSLLGKSLVAQAVFNSGFLLPFSPESPQFFLVPGNGSVSILWQPSASETSGDAFFQLASSPTTTDPVTGEVVPNILYDPNYRQFDVEGYRIYRGRTDSPSELQVIAQFDYAGTLIRDFAGQVNPVPGCAPELGINVTTTDPVTGEVTTACPVDFDTVVAGQARTVFFEYPLVGEIIQTTVAPGGSPARIALANGTAFVTAADTAVTGSASGEHAPLADTGVPFVYEDRSVRNNFRYFYSVVAFDVNSFQSGPSNLESARATKSTTPVATSPNAVTATLESGLFGADGTELDPEADWAIDGATGKFVGPPPPSNAISGVFSPFVPSLLPALNLAGTLDSVKSLYATRPECAGVTNLPLLFGINTCYIMYLTFDRDGALTQFTVPTAWPVWSGFGEPSTMNVALGSLPIEVNPTAASSFGVPASGLRTANAALGADLRQSIEFSSFEGQAARRGLTGGNADNGCIDAAATNCSTSASPGGSRWFSGANETVDHPTVGLRAGRLDGVDTIVGLTSHHIDVDPATPGGQLNVNDAIIQFFGYGFSGLGRQADVVITWGTGTVESVTDVTHHVPVSFKPDAQASYGFVQDADGDGLISWLDFNYITGVCEYWINQVAVAGCTADVSEGRDLLQQPVVTPVSSQRGAADLGQANPVATGQGFGLYINGERYIFQLTGGAFPAAGATWTLRTYSGRVRASTGPATATPSGYSFTPVVRSAAVPGVTVQFAVAAATTVRATTDEDLSRVHTVPDPYYVTNEFETSTDTKIIKFVNLPTQAIIRIYSSSGVLVSLLEHQSSTFGGSIDWNVRNRNNQVVASGVYFYHLESGDARRVGRFTVVNFAQ
jgi:hypothetical protein